MPPRQSSVRPHETERLSFDFAGRRLHPVRPPLLRDRERPSPLVDAIVKYLETVS